MLSKSVSGSKYMNMHPSPPGRSSDPLGKQARNPAPFGVSDMSTQKQKPHLREVQLAVTVNFEGKLSSILEGAWPASRETLNIVITAEHPPKMVLGKKRKAASDTRDWAFRPQAAT